MQEIKQLQIAHNGTMTSHILHCVLPVNTLVGRDERPTRMTHTQGRSGNGAICTESDRVGNLTETLMPHREHDSP